MPEFVFLMLILFSAFSGGVALFGAWLHGRVALERRRALPHLGHLLARGGYGVMILTLAHRLLEIGASDDSPAAWVFLVGLVVSAFGHSILLTATIRGVADFEEAHTSPPPPPVVYESAMENSIEDHNRPNEEEEWIPES